MKRGTVLKTAVLMIAFIMISAVMPAMAGEKNSPDNFIKAMRFAALMMDKEELARFMSPDVQYLGEDLYMQGREKVLNYIDDNNLWSEYIEAIDGGYAEIDNMDGTVYYQLPAESQNPKYHGFIMMIQKINGQWMVVNVGDV